MTIPVSIKTMREATRFAGICRTFPYELMLCGPSQRIDPKSVLGIYALMYLAKDSMTIDTGDMEDKLLPKFIKAIGEYLPEKVA